MVDYNIAIPQQQLFQAPDFTQNAMRMQQAQLQEMQIQALARKNSEARNIQQLYARPGFDMTSPEAINQFGQVGGYKAATAALVAARQAQNLERQTAATNAGLAQTYQTMGETAYTNAQNRLAAIPAGDAEAYAGWLATHGAAYKGVKLPTVEQWSQDPTGKLQGHMVATSQSVRESMKPQLTTIGGVPAEYTPGKGAKELGITPFAPQGADTGAGAGTGPATAAMNPDRLATMQATQARLGLPVMQPSAAGANAAVNNMPGAATPVPVVGNAMAAPPTTEAGAKNTLRAAPIGAGEFIQQQEAQKEQRKAQIAQEAAQILTPVQEQKMRTDVGEARANAGESMATLQETLRAAKDVLALPEEAKNAISGYTGKYTPNLSASAKDAQTKFNDVVGQITAMSKASAGSIGSMAVQEWKILADQVASLDLTNMDAKTLDRQMKIIVNRAEGLMNRTRSNYTNTYGPLMEKYKGQFDLPAPTPSIAIGIDPRAIEKLRNDPSMAKAFDEHFGRPGAAAAILGK